MKSVMKLRGEPVAVKLVAEGEDYPEGYTEPESQLSHCQAIFRAREGECFKLPVKSENCMVGCSALNMAATPEKVASGEFHANIGMHDSPAAAGKMISDRMVVPTKNQGEIVCPLKNADFVPDVVTIEDIPERVYWIVPLATAEEGGRVQFSTSPFQCGCEDIVAVPICTGKPNIFHERKFLAVSFALLCNIIYFTVAQSSFKMIGLAAIFVCCCAGQML